MKIIVIIITVAIQAIWTGDSDYKDNIKKSLLKNLLKEILLWLIPFFLQKIGIYIDTDIISMVLDLLFYLYDLYFKLMK